MNLQAGCTCAHLFAGSPFFGESWQLGLEPDAHVHDFETDFVNAGGDLSKQDKVATLFSGANS